MATDVFNVGDLVWAKMKGFSPWPGKIVNPTKDVKRPAYKKPMQCVYFFGSNNYAWILEEAIKPYAVNKEALSKPVGKKSANFKEALEAIEDYIRNKPETSDLPSIGEEIATIFPNGHKHKDYSRQPFLGKSQGKSPDDEMNSFGSKSPKDQNETSSTGDVVDEVSTPEPSAAPPAPKKDKPKKDGAHKPTKRVGADGGGGGHKRAKADKDGDSRPSGKKGGGGSSGSSGLLNSTAIGYSSPGHSSQSGSSSQPTTNHNTPRKATENIIMRSAYISRPATPPINVGEISETLLAKNVEPSKLKFGFLGLGIIGQGIVKNLLNSGHSVTVWNRTPSKCREFVKGGAVKGQTPADVVAVADITFACVADPQAAKDMVFGNCGVLQEMRSGKGYIEMTSIDAETSQDIAEAIMSRGGRYLEAQVQGSKVQSEHGNLIALAAGDKSLFDDSQSCFQAMGKSSFYLGEVGNACKMNLVVNVMMGASIAGLSEAMALAERAGLQQKDVLEVLDLSPMCSSLIIEKGKAIIDGSFSTEFPLQHMQKDLRLALELGDQLEQPLPLTATTNEMFKHAKRLGYGEHDVSAVYIRSRF